MRSPCTHEFDNRDKLIAGLGLSLPTGKDALHGFDAVMSEDLVEKSRFGNGFDVVPSLWYHRVLDDDNTLIFGTYATFGGNYTTDTTQPSRVNPGTAWVQEFAWKHETEHWQWQLGMAYTHYNGTTEGSNRYTTGPRFAPNVTVNWSPDKKQFFTAYYWGARESPLRNTNFGAISETRNSRNYGLQYALMVAPKHRVRAYYDRLDRRGQNYDPITRLTTNTRHKDTFGVGYDYFIDDEMRLMFGLERFSMKDGAYADSKANRYHGVNAYVRLFGYF